MVLDRATSELVERSTFQAYGAAESDYRPGRWAGFRADYRFTGKEEDIEVGVQYFGGRMYSPWLARWCSADPVTIHRLGSDLNLYAYVAGTSLASTDPHGESLVPAMAAGFLIGAGTETARQVLSGEDWDPEATLAAGVAGMAGAAAGYTVGAAAGSAAAGVGGAEAGNAAAVLAGGAAAGVTSEGVGRSWYGEDYSLDDAMLAAGKGASMAAISHYGRQLWNDEVSQREPLRRVPVRMRNSGAFSTGEPGSDAAAFYLRQDEQLAAADASMRTKYGYTPFADRPGWGERIFGTEGGRADYRDPNTGEPVLGPRWSHWEQRDSLSTIAFGGALESVAQRAGVGSAFARHADGSVPFAGALVLPLAAVWGVCHSDWGACVEAGLRR